MNPTKEQQAIVKAFASTNMLKINAYAGSGKSSTLKLLAQNNLKRSLYIAFNKAIADEAASKFPAHVECRTTHSLAFSAFGRGMMHKLARPKGRYVNVAGTPSEIVKYYKIEEYKCGDDSVSSLAIAAIVKDTVRRYEQSAEDKIYKQHLPGYRLSELKDKYPELDKKALGKHCLKLAQKLWEGRLDMCSPVLCTHDTYLKLFQMSKPTLDYDILYLDEAQDTNDVVLDIVLRQTHCKIALVGDNFQCVGGETKLTTPSGPVSTKDLKVGDRVMSHRNGRNTFQTVNAIKKSSWERGILITTESGKKLHMSPNHKIWASDFELTGTQHIVYLMYRWDMGYRVGITNKYKDSSKLGQRAVSERACKLWVLDVVENREEALLKENFYSLQYGIPTCVFCGERRGLNQGRIDKIFAVFGDNGEKLLKDKNLEFEMPNYLSPNKYVQGFERINMNIHTHSSKGTNIAFEWNEDSLAIKKLLEDAGVMVTNAKNHGRYRVRKYFNSYLESMKFVDYLHSLGDWFHQNEKFSVKGHNGRFRMNVAASLVVGSSVLVKDGDTIKPERIVSILGEQGEFYDISVDDTCNFFGNGILSHNSIYAFRGAVNAMEKINVETLSLTKSFRFGHNIAKVATAIIQSDYPDTPMVHGNELIEDVIDDIDYGQKHTRIYRTNSALLADAVQLVEAGCAVSCEIDTNDFKKLIESAQALFEGNSKGVKHDSIVPYKVWSELMLAAKDDAELKRVAAIINSGQTDVYLDALSQLRRRNDCLITLTTAHKSKGREWSQVVLADDFPKPGADGKIGGQEINLLYVAATRAVSRLFINDSISIILEVQA